MQRITTTPRLAWAQKVEALGFGFHTLDQTYWDETAYWSFTLAEIERIETATNTLWELCLEAVQHIIDERKYALFHIPTWFVPHIERTWNEDAPSVYGRFDFTFQAGIPKMLEFNADTPTSLFESSVVQWTWLEERMPHKDQFNSIHEKLIAYWTDEYTPPLLHFTCLKDNLEDFTTTEYLRDTAIQAGLNTKFVYLEDIGRQADTQQFVDLDGEAIRDIFKLYPYEWLIDDEFGRHILQDPHDTHWIEPSWKMLLSNKAILPILYQLFPDCPYLLPTYFDAVDLKDYVKKPLLSREGANITVVKNNQYQTHTEGEYGAEGFVYQALCPLPEADGNFALVGSWVIGQQAAGIGIRESRMLITDNTSRFVPHVIVG